jgi:hypothetical protein
LAWRHPGFWAHVAEPIAADDTQAIEHLAGYVVRNALSLQRLVYLDGQQAIIYKALAKVFHTDPLTCRKCGGKLKIVAYLHDQVAIDQILDHLGRSPPEEPKPPPAVPEVVRVPVDEEGREIEAS